MTILFWCIAAAMLALALLFVLPPLLRRAPSSQTANVDELNITVHRARLEELEEQYALGSLSDEQFGLAREELQRALLADVTVPSTPAAARTQRAWVAAGVVALAIPLASVVIYQLVGSKQALSTPSPSAQASAADAQPLTEMVESLRRRLTREPEDAEGWLLLARSYSVLERHQEALAAYARARTLLGDDATLLAEYAQTLAEHQGGQLTGEPRNLLERAVGLDPSHQRARWLAGFAALQAGDSERALLHWNVLIAQLPPDSDEARMVRELSARITATQTLAAEEEVERPDRGIDVRVTIDDALAAETNPGDIVFVFARAVDAASRAPLAIARLAVGDLPQTVRLDDSLSMVPGRKLSNFQEVIVGARVSRTGQPIAQPGDLQGLSAPVAVTVDEPVNIVISSRIPASD